MEIETEISISGVLTETRTMNSAKRYNEFRELHKEVSRSVTVMILNTETFIFTVYSISYNHTE